MAAIEIKSITEIAFHRNGVCGRGFYAVRFTADVKKDGDIKPIKDAKWLAILTDDEGECYVICTDLLEVCGVKFAAGNSWRGDHFESELRAAIKAQENEHSGGVRFGPFTIPTV